MNNYYDLEWIFVKNISDNICLKVSNKGDLLIINNSNQNNFIKRRIEIANFNLFISDKDVMTIINDINKIDETLLVNKIDNIICQKINDLNVH